MEQQTAILVRFPGLRERGIVQNRTTLGRWIRELGFPKPIHLGPNSRAWRLSEVEEWVRQREGRK